VLVVKLADLGDVLTATPAIRALREGLPDAHLAALLTPHGARVLEGWDALDEVVPFPKALFDRPWTAALRAPVALALGRQLSGRFDAVVLLHHLTTAWGALKYAALALASRAPVRAGLDNGRGWFLTHRAPDHGFGARHEAEYWLSVAALLGGSGQPRPLEAPRGDEAEAWAERRWRKLGFQGRRVAALHPGSGGFSLARRWPPDRFAAVGARLLEQGVERVLVLGGPAPGETDLASRVTRQIIQGFRATAAESVGEPGSRPLDGQDGRQLALGEHVAGPERAGVVADAPGPQHVGALLSRCALFVGNDSGLMHLAVAVGLPTVGIFGPSNDRAWGPYPRPGQPAFVVRERLACSPCIYVGHRLGTPQGCAARTCLDLVEPDAVVAAAQRALREAAAVAVPTARP
jgi:heptosyltransferase-2